MAAEAPAQREYSAPLFLPPVEARLTESLNALLLTHESAGSAVDAERLAPLGQAAARLVDSLYAEVGTECDFAGPSAHHGSDYIHPVKVAELAVVIGHQLGEPRSRLIALAVAACLMNLGYVRVRRALLDEPRDLTEAEWSQVVRAHPEMSVEVLRQAGVAASVTKTILQHHERWDGGGYPAGVRGDEIVLAARIVAVADTYVSLRTYRPHRKAMGVAEALQIIAEGAGTAFDPEIARACAEAVSACLPQERVTKAARLGTVEPGRARHKDAVGARNALARFGPPPDLDALRAKVAEAAAQAERAQAARPRGAAPAAAASGHAAPAARVRRAPQQAAAHRVPSRPAPRPRPAPPAAVQRPDRAVRTAGRHDPLYRVDVFLRSEIGSGSE